MTPLTALITGALIIVEGMTTLPSWKAQLCPWDPVKHRPDRPLRAQALCFGVKKSLPLIGSEIKGSGKFI